MTWMTLGMTRVTSILAKNTFECITDRQTNQWTDQQSRCMQLNILHLGMKNDCWMSLLTHFTTFPGLRLHFFKHFLLFEIFWKKSSWNLFKMVGLNWLEMTSMTLGMTKVTSLLAKNIFERMRYRPTDQPTEGPPNNHLFLRG